MPLLLLLRHVAEDPSPRDAQQAHMTRVLEALCVVEVEESNEVDEERGGYMAYFWSRFDDDVDDARDACVRLLAGLGADVFAPYVANSRRVVARLVRECVQLAGVPRLINDAVVGIEGGPALRHLIEAVVDMAAARESLLLGHPPGDTTATVAGNGTDGESMLVSAARFAAGWRAATPTSPARSCMPLLLLLRRVAEDPPPHDAQQAHMTQVLEALCEEEVEVIDEVYEERGGHMVRVDMQVTRSCCVFDDHKPHDALDGCVRLLLAGDVNMFAPGVSNSHRVVARLVRECVQLAGVPRLINDVVVGIEGRPALRHLIDEAVVSMAGARKRTRDDE